MRAILSSLCFALVITSLAQGHTYYPQNFSDKFSNGLLKNQELKNELHLILTSSHLRNKDGKRDTLGCPTPGVANCYAHRSLGYDGARKVLFGKLHIEEENGKYYIRDVYCHKIFAGGADVRPGAIPNNNQINCEHTWPQSKFSSLYPKDIQKADLHHLYPTDSKANSIRGNLDFAEITSEIGGLDANCDASKFGTTAGDSGDHFEPPTEHKGNVARALFYFSVRYKISIPENEESVLRKWHEMDPVDDLERERNDQIYYAQGNRNPFIDYPILSNYISRF